MKSDVFGSIYTTDDFGSSHKSTYHIKLGPGLKYIKRIWRFVRISRSLKPSLK